LENKNDRGIAIAILFGRNQQIASVDGSRKRNWAAVLLMIMIWKQEIG